MENDLAYSVYSELRVGIESPQRLVEVLYEGVLCFCVRVKHAIRNEDVKQRVYLVKHVTTTSIKLTNNLDYKKGGKIAFYLMGLYTREVQPLSLANLGNNEEKIDEVINVTRGLLETWRRVHSNEDQ